MYGLQSLKYLLSDVPVWKKFIEPWIPQGTRLKKKKKAVEFLPQVTNFNFQVLIRWDSLFKSGFVELMKQDGMVRIFLTRIWLASLFSSMEILGSSFLPTLLTASYCSARRRWILANSNISNFDESFLRGYNLLPCLCLWSHIARHFEKKPSREHLWRKAIKLFRAFGPSSAYTLICEDPMIITE